MIGFRRFQSGSQDAPQAPAASCRKRGGAGRPGGGAVRARAAFHVHGASDDLFGCDAIALDMVVAADKKAWTFRTGDTAVQAMRNETVGGRRVENDVSDTQVLFARRFDGEKIAVAYEWRHAGPVRGEADGVALGQEIAGQATEER
jgi:hypothetical protein